MTTKKPIVRVRKNHHPPDTATVEVTWPSEKRNGMPVGCLIAMSVIEPVNLPPRAVVDIYRHEGDVLVRCDLKVVQDPLLAIGSTAQSTIDFLRRRHQSNKNEKYDLIDHREQVDQAIVDLVTIIEERDWHDEYGRKLAQAKDALVSAMAGSSGE